MDIAKQEAKQAQNPFSQAILRPEIVPGQIGSKVPVLNIDFGHCAGRKPNVGIQLTPKMLERLSVDRRVYDHYEQGRWLEPQVKYVGFGFSDLYSGAPELPDIKYVLFSNSTSGFCMTLKTAFAIDPFIFTSVEASKSEKPPPPPAGLVFSRNSETMGMVPLTEIRAAQSLPKSAIPIVPARVPLLRAQRGKKSRKDMIERIWSFAVEPAPKSQKQGRRLSLPRPIARITKILARK
ncbi:MAG: hypothetical protein WC506_03770 [Candidatus Micrarchaeia archaeon]